MSKAQFLKDNIKPGETYLGFFPQGDFHLVEIAVSESRMTYHEAEKWAKSVGGCLPTDFEEMIASFGDRKSDWFWVRTNFAGLSKFQQNYASKQVHGQLHTGDIYRQNSARSVRRIYLHETNFAEVEICKQRIMQLEKQIESLVV